MSEAYRALLLLLLVEAWNIHLSWADSPATNPTCGPLLEIPDCTPKQECDTAQDTRDCSVCLIKNPFGGCLSRATDPTCEAIKAAQNQAYAASKASCEANKLSQKAQCELVKQSIMQLNARQADECPIIDEARLAGRSAQSFPAADEDYFKGMDGGIALSPDEVKGRNMWLVWTGGNDRLWDKLTNLTYGTFDLLKILSSYPGLKYSRDNRFNYFGLVNEPCFTKATGPDPQRYGLWLDQRNADCPADPFANEQKYPGVAVRARGKNIPIGSYYGYPTGVLGLRLFPNPAFNQAAAALWDPERFYKDPD